MVFLLAAILAMLVSLFEVFVMLKFTVCPLPLEGIHYVTQWIFISMDFSNFTFSWCWYQLICLTPSQLSLVSLQKIILH